MERFSNFSVFLDADVLESGGTILQISSQCGFVLFFPMTRFTLNIFLADIHG